MVWIKIILTSIFALLCVRLIGSIFWPDTSVHDMPKPVVAVLGVVLVLSLLAIFVSVPGLIWFS